MTYSEGHNNMPKEEDLYCPAHSGTRTWITVGIGLLIFLNGLVGYQVFFQVPALKYDVTRRIDSTENRITAVERDLSNLKAVRNADHPSSTQVR
jgi:hypothetical protein